MDPSEHIFGKSKLKQVKIGDLVRWHTLVKSSERAYRENIGIVTSVHIDHRGGRDVAVANIIPLGPQGGHLCEVEVFLACLKVISPSKVT